MSRRARVALVAVALAGGLAGGLAGCKKKAKPPPAAVRVPPMPAAEVTRGKAACDDLVAKLCACSAAQPDNVSRSGPTVRRMQARRRAPRNGAPIQPEVRALDSVNVRHARHHVRPDLIESCVHEHRVDAQ